MRARVTIKAILEEDDFETIKETIESAIDILRDDGDADVVDSEITELSSDFFSKQLKEL